MSVETVETTFTESDRVMLAEIHAMLSQVLTDLEPLRPYLTGEQSVTDMLPPQLRMMLGNLGM